MPNPRKRKQWRVKTTEAFQNAYGTSGNPRKELIINYHEEVDLKGDPGSLTPYVGNESMFWRDVTGDDGLHFIGLGSSHWESYERIVEEEPADEEIR